MHARTFTPCHHDESHHHKNTKRQKKEKEKQLQLLIYIFGFLEIKTELKKNETVNLQLLSSYDVCRDVSSNFSVLQPLLGVQDKLVV